MRLAKFAALTNSHCWNEQAGEEWKTELQREIQDLTLEAENALEIWTSNGTVPVIREAPRLMDPELAGEVRGYYVEKRVNAQLRYLSTRFPKERKSENATKYIGPILFYASVVVVFTHTVMDFGAEPKESWLRVIVFLAASLPAFAAAVRTHRAAREYGRNALRPEATYHTLRELESRLAAESGPAAIFQTIGFCEQVLEADTREWMCLMREAEWFG